MKYIIVFLLCMIATSALINLQSPSTMAVGVSDIKPVSHGLIRDEGGMGELRITDSPRSWLYTTEITTRHPARDSDFPHFGNN